MFFNYQGANNAQAANGGYGLFANMPNPFSYSPKWGYDDDYLKYLALSSLFGNNNTVAQSASAIPVAQGIPVYNPYAAAQINPNMLWAYDDDYLKYAALSSLFGNNNTAAQSTTATSQAAQSASAIPVAQGIPVAQSIPVAQGIPVYNPYASAQINPNMLWPYDDDMFDMDDIKVIAVPGANGAQQYVIFDD